MADKIPSVMMKQPDGMPKADARRVNPRRPGRECQDCEGFVLWNIVDPGPGHRDHLTGSCRGLPPNGRAMVDGYNPQVTATYWCLLFRPRLALDALATTDKATLPEPGK